TACKASAQRSRTGHPRSPPPRGGVQLSAVLPTVAPLTEQPQQQVTGGEEPGDPWPVGEEIPQRAPRLVEPLIGRAGPISGLRQPHDEDSGASRERRNSGDCERL